MQKASSWTGWQPWRPVPELNRLMNICSRHVAAWRGRLRKWVRLICPASGVTEILVGVPKCHCADSLPTGQRRSAGLPRCRRRGSSRHGVQRTAIAFSRGCRQTDPRNNSWSGCSASQASPGLRTPENEDKSSLLEAHPFRPSHSNINSLLI